MGTIPRQKVTGTVLPPPPAPTSRDANPWPMSASRLPPRLPGLRVNPIKISDRLKVAPAPPARVPTPASQPNLPVKRVTLLPFVILGGVLIAVGSNALESFDRGDYFGALFPLLVVGLIAAGAVRTLLRRRP